MRLEKAGCIALAMLLLATATPAQGQTRSEVKRFDGSRYVDPSKGQPCRLTDRLPLVVRIVTASRRPGSTIIEAWDLAGQPVEGLTATTLGTCGGETVFDPPSRILGEGLHGEVASIDAELAVRVLVFLEDDLALVVGRTPGRDGKDASAFGIDGAVFVQVRELLGP